MGLLSGLFSEKNDKKSVNFVDDSNENIDDIIIFKPHKLLIEISDDLINIDEFFSETSNKFAFNSNLSSSELDIFLVEIDDKITNLTSDLKGISDPSSIFSKLKQTCANISSYNFENRALDYLEFLDCSDFLYLSDELEIFQTIFTNSLKFENSDKIFNLFRNCRTEYDFIVKKSNILSKTNTELSTEIINYTNAVNSVRAKNRLSVDWNGKKPALMSLGNQLNSKRSDFLNQEKELNNKIIQLYSTYNTAHNFFKLHCYDIIEILENNSENLSYNYDNQIKIISNYIKKLKIAKNKLVDFIDEFNTKKLGL